MVGVYLSPSETSLVLAVSEKSQIQALDRAQPVMSMAPTTPTKMTHAYFRHGTSSLFAALDIASDSVLPQHYRRHRHQELLRFLKVIAPHDVRLLLDNYAAHKAEPVKKWTSTEPETMTSWSPSRPGRTGHEGWPARCHHGRYIRLVSPGTQKEVCQ